MSTRLPRAHATTKRSITTSAAKLALILSTLLATPAHATDVHIHGLLDVVAAERGHAFDFNRLTRGDSQFDPYGLRLFVDANANDRLQVFSQLVVRDAASPYVDGAYLMFTPSLERDLHVLGGKVPWLIGTYAPRTYSNKNPLIGAPLMYQYHTTLLWYEIVPSTDALLATAGRGQYGANYFGYSEGKGMAMIDDSYWDVGATVTGSARPFEYAMGVVAGTPGWGSTSEDENSGKSVLARVGIAPSAGLRFGVSAAYGPYLIQALNPKLPTGKDVNDYHQKLGMIDGEFLAGRIEARGEAARNVWETPTVGKLGVTSGYVELKYILPFGGFTAGRLDVMRFGDVTDSTGAKRPWDSDVTRIEAGAGYRFDRNVMAKVVWQRTSLAHEDHDGAIDHRKLSMVAAQLSVGF